MVRKLRREALVLCTVAILLAGCKSSQSATAPSAGSGGPGTQSGGKPGAATYVSASPLSSQLTTAK
ncbi:MAG TPA: hypothetical protein VMT38_07070, partial [Terracidiphilus sp.]|nr:hypothetical protein [Terracidiphilus sp.]